MIPAFFCLQKLECWSGKDFAVVGTIYWFFLAYILSR
jgi:hypothetical protein